MGPVRSFALVLLVLVATSIPSAVAHAASAEAMKLWQGYFPNWKPGNPPGGTLLHFLTGRYQEPLVGWLDAKGCEDEVEHVRRWISGYSKHAYDLDGDEAQGLADKIQDYLFTTLGETHPCFTTAANAYLILSVSRLNQFSGTELSFLALFLAKAGKIQFLTPNNRVPLGGLFNASEDQPPGGKGKKRKRYSLMGAYKCSLSEIQIDITLPPYNLAGALIHEVDHLFRDKYFNPHMGNLGPVAQIVIDETLASVHAAFLQRRLEGPTPPVLVSMMGYRRPFRIDNDRTLYSKKGDLQDLFHDFEEYNTSTMQFEFFLKRTFLQKAVTKEFPREPLLNEQDEKTLYEFTQKEVFTQHYDLAKLFNDVLDHVNSIYDKVIHNYFGKSLGKTLRAELDPQANALNLSPLSRWVIAYNSDVLDGIQDSPRESGPDLDRLIEASYALSKKLADPSVACKDFQAALKTREMVGYIGNPCTEKQFAEGKCPWIGGTDGVKPGTDGVKPCLLPHKTF